MALDIIAAKDKFVATRLPKESLATASVALESAVHDLIGDSGCFGPEFPWLTRLSDYYRDATFHCQELDALRVDIGKALQRFPSGPARKFLIAFDQLCRNAYRDQLSLFACCD